MSSNYCFKNLIYFNNHELKQNKVSKSCLSTINVCTCQ